MGEWIMTTTEFEELVRTAQEARVALAAAEAELNSKNSEASAANAAFVQAGNDLYVAEQAVLIAIPDVELD
jgi:hypothetical protein